MAYILPVAGGKGGVGKSIYSLNIAITLAKQCKKVILVDDIYTTGNTVNECSKILKKAGAKEIIVVTIAKD